MIIKHLKYLIITSLCLFLFMIRGKESVENNVPISTVESAAHIVFDYTNESLIPIINNIAAHKKINIVLPQGVNVIKEKLTYKAERVLTVDQAWELLITILDLADYTVTERENVFVILKKNPEVIREPLPVYIGVAPDQLPISDESIRYLYYLSNVKVSTEPDHEINVVLRELLSTNALFRVDTNTNALLIVDKSTKIKDAMDIIVRLDQVGFQEKMEFIVLHHTNAPFVADLLNEGILKAVNSDANRYHLDARKQAESSYFSRGTKVIAVKHSNSLIIIGRAQAVDRLKEFIQQNIDTELDSGKSILHIFQLQYLNAEKFEPVLRSIVEASRSGGTGQSAAGDVTGKGTERFFDEVIIKTDKPMDGEDLKYYGGNKIIVACRNEDAKQIEKLIEELDTPQPQVLLEVLVADLSIDDTRLLGSLTRNPNKVPILNTMQFQSAQLNPSVVLDQVPDPTTVASDLLGKVFNNAGVQVDSAEATKSAAAFTSPGSGLISLNDNNGKTWNITQILKLCANSRILSHPHVIATNNKPALVRTGEERLLKDETSEAAGGAAVRKNKKIVAELRVEITPRISSADTVNLQVKVTINDFIPGTDAQTTREVTTNANVQSGAIFALGGLVSVSNNQSETDTPGLSKVPLLGWLFKSRQGEVKKNNLTVFISPTVIQPRLRRGIGEYTQDYIDVAKKYGQEGFLFDNIKDPITHWFFKTGNKDLDADAAIERFTTKDQLLAQNIPKAPSRKRKTSGQKKAVDVKAVEMQEGHKDDLAAQSHKEGQLEEELLATSLKEKLQNDVNPFVAQSLIQKEVVVQS